MDVDTNVPTGEGHIDPPISENSIGCPSHDNAYSDDSLFDRAFRMVAADQFKTHLKSLLNLLQLKDSRIESLQHQHAIDEININKALAERSELERRLAESEDSLQSKSKELEEEKTQRKADATLAEEKLRKHDDAAKRAIQQFQLDVNAKLMEASKQVEDIRRERESAVMRFAQAEQQVIDCKSTAEKFENQCKLALKERDFFQERIKMLTEEKKKMQAFIDQKTVEVAQLQKDCRDAKESAKEADIKMKLAQSKAKSELDAHQETRLRLERIQQQLIAVKDELEHTKQDLNDKEQNHLREKTQNELQRQQENFQQRMELAEINERLRFELDSLKQKHRDTLEENRTLKDRETCLESELTEFKTELSKEVAEKSSLKEEAQAAREEAQAARERAGELVDHNNQLSLYRSQIQAETSGLRENLADLQRDFSSATEENNKLKTESATLMAQLAEERRTQTTTIEQLQCELNRTKESLTDLQRRLSEQESLLISSRRKYNREVKELQRQLRGQQPHHSSEQPHLEVNAGVRGLSRASSHNSDLDLQQHHQTPPASSLRNGEQLPHNNGSAPVTETAVAINGDHQVAVIIGGSNEVSRQQIIERLVGLQRALAKKSEKVDFLSEQVRILMDEVQKKSRIIQVLATRETAESGAFLSDSMEKHRTSMSKRSGIMASVLSSELQDGKMTLDLSLEISRKLQEVLEETLLKNIMLKESLDTLGHEISHLSKENRDLKLTLKGVLEEMPGSGRK